MNPPRGDGEGAAGLQGPVTRSQNLAAGIGAFQRPFRGRVPRPHQLGGLREPLCFSPLKSPGFQMKRRTNEPESRCPVVLPHQGRGRGATWHLPISPFGREVFPGGPGDSGGTCEPATGGSGHRLGPRVHLTRSRPCRVSLGRISSSCAGKEGASVKPPPLSG